MPQSIITGTGSFIPTVVHANSDFVTSEFYAESGVPFPGGTEEIIRKFESITGINERRYADGNLTASDIGARAAEAALQDSGIDREELDQVIVAHNFGNVLQGTIQTDAVPSLAARIKHTLGIRNPSCIAYDILFGCPGWIQGLIQAEAFFRAGMASKALVVGTETLSRVIDLSDRDSMIFSDGAGAAVLERKENAKDNSGILSTCAVTHTAEEVEYINMGPSFSPGSDPGVRYIKMKGRKVYEYAMTHVPAAMKQCLDASGAGVDQLKKIFIHQANAKMDDGIVQRFYRLYNVRTPPDGILPMSIHWLGNSSVATVPTLLDLVRKGKMAGHSLQKGDVILFASVGAGMSINAICYRY